MMPGGVGKVRELERGVEAEVCVGWTKNDYVNIKVTSRSPAVTEALSALKAALKAEAHTLLRDAQEDERRRGRKAVGA